MIEYTNHSNEHSSPLEVCKGIPQKPVAVIETISNYYDNSASEARSPAFGGVIIASQTTPAERAARAVFRPQTDIVEIGPYTDGNYDLVTSLSSHHGHVMHNGDLISNTQALNYIRDLSEAKGIGQLHLHLNSPSLAQVGSRLGLRIEEDTSRYNELSKKTNLLRSIEEFNRTHPDSTLGALGQEFTDAETIMYAIIQLGIQGYGSCIKVDEFTQGEPLNGGFGVITIPDIARFGSSGYNEAQEHIINTLQSRGLSSSEIRGVVQLYSPRGKILSISSGLNQNGEYVIYEAHQQTQIVERVGTDSWLASDGAVPLRPVDQVGLLNNVWPQLADLYKSMNLRGDQNMNFIVLTKEELAFARRMYNQPRMSRYVPLDLNPRPISGTKASMGRFIEETGQSVMLDNFISRSIRVPQHVAMNPDIIYADSTDLGLIPGERGNFSVTNFGHLKPSKFGTAESFPIKVFAQDLPDTAQTVAQLEARLQRFANLSSQNIAEEHIDHHVIAQKFRSTIR